MSFEVENLVTGGTGFIGSHLVRLLLEKGEEVVVISRSGEKGLNLRDVKNRNLKVIKADLQDLEGLRKNIPRAKYVYHLAGLVRTSRYHRDRIFAINYFGTVNLFRVLEEKLPEKVVYLASIFALGKGTKDKPADETVEYNLQKLSLFIPYFSAKKQAQEVVESLAERGFPVVFVYPCFCVGPGDVYLSSTAFVYLYMKGLIKVWWDGGINLMDVRDAAKGLYLGMKRGRVGEKYLIGGENLTFKEVFDYLAKATGVPAPGLKLPRFAVIWGSWILELMLGEKSPVDYGSAHIMTDYWFYSDEKARKELRYSSASVESALADAVKWFREHEREVRWR